MATTYAGLAHGGVVRHELRGTKLQPALFPRLRRSNLQPEEGKHRRVERALERGRCAAGPAAWFDNRIRSYIPSGPVPANVPRTRIDGVALSYDGRWDTVTLGASFEHIDPRNATPGPNDGKLLPRRARNAARAHADWAFGDYSVGATLVADSDRYDDPANTLPRGRLRYVDLRCNWFVARDWTLGVRLNNVTGKDYETVFGFDRPGRELYVTLRYATR